MTWLSVLLAFGATARLTLLVTADAFPPVLAVTHRVRARVFARYQHRDDLSVPEKITAIESNWLLALIGCPWCISWWIGIPAVSVARYWPDSWWFQLPAAALTASLLTGYAGQARK